MNCVSILHEFILDHRLGKPLKSRCSFVSKKPCKRCTELTPFTYSVNTYLCCPVHLPCAHDYVLGKQVFESLKILYDSKKLEIAVIHRLLYLAMTVCKTRDFYNILLGIYVTDKESVYEAVNSRMRSFFGEQNV
jgi:hypothetical protein